MEEQKSHNTFFLIHIISFKMSSLYFETSSSILFSLKELIRKWRCNRDSAVVEWCTAEGYFSIFMLVWSAVSTTGMQEEKPSMLSA